MFLRIELMAGNREVSNRFEKYIPPIFSAISTVEWGAGVIQFPILLFKSLLNRFAISALFQLDRFAAK